MRQLAWVWQRNQYKQLKPSPTPDLMSLIPWSSDLQTLIKRCPFKFTFCVSHTDYGALFFFLFCFLTSCTGASIVSTANANEAITYCLTKTILQRWWIKRRLFLWWEGSDLHSTRNNHGSNVHPSSKLTFLFHKAVWDHSSKVLLLHLN